MRGVRNRRKNQRKPLNGASKIEREALEISNRLVFAQQPTELLNFLLQPKSGGKLRKKEEREEREEWEEREEIETQPFRNEGETSPL